MLFIYIFKYVSTVDLPKIISFKRKIERLLLFQLRI